MEGSRTCLPVSSAWGTRPLDGFGSFASTQDLSRRFFRVPVSLHHSSHHQDPPLTITDAEMIGVIYLAKLTNIATGQTAYTKFQGQG